MLDKKKISFMGIVIWFTCAFFYALEYFIRSSTGALYDSFLLNPYNFSTASVAMFSSSFYWAYVISQIPAGILVDKFGVKKVMMVSTFVFSIAILVASFSSTIHAMVIYRVLAGFGGGFAFLCSIKSISIWLPNRLFPAFTGMTQFLLYIGATLSAAPLVYVSNFFTIKEIMMGIFVVSLIVLLFSIFVVRVHPDYSKDNKSSKDDRSNGVLEVLRNKQVWLNGLYCFTIYGTTVLFADLWGIHYLTNVSGMSEITAGLCTSMIFIGVALFSPMWGLVATVFNGERRFLLVAPIFGFFIVSAILYFPVTEFQAICLCVLFGGVQAVHVLNYSSLRNTVSIMHIATGLALVNLFLPLSGGVLQPITGLMIESLKASHGIAYAYKTTMLFIPVLMILSVIIALFIKDKK